MRCLMVDIGSTHLKSTAYDAASGQKGEVTRLPFPAPSRNDAPFFEVDAEAIVSVLRDMIRGADAQALYLSTQMHGYLLGDSTGKAITPYISWRDERSLLLPEAVRYPFALPQQRGVSLKPNLPLAGLAMIRRHMPAVWQRAACFYTLGSYLCYRLTGVNAAHITDLAPTGAYDAQTGRLACRAFPIAFPRVWMGLSPVTQCNGMHVYPAVGDHQASTLGSGLDAQAYLLNLGTAAQLCAISPTPIYGDYESRPYFNGQTLCTVTRLTGGAVIAARIADPAFAHELCAEYALALQKLPVRKHILAVGGVCSHFPGLIQSVLEGIGLAYTCHPTADALDGLIRLHHAHANT